MSGSDEGEWLEVKGGLKAIWDGFLGLLPNYTIELWKWD